jgi:rfaE bifunctional protein kinase chain/domain
MNKNLIKTVNKFRNKKILVVGDLMLDKYIWGEVERISPEAPVQVVKVVTESYSPGGAANCANNVASLGAQTFLVGAVGADEARKKLLSLIKSKNINIEGVFDVARMSTIQKIRILAKNQQLLRIDYEKDSQKSSTTERNIITYLKSKIKEVDAVIISTYAKGAITKKIAMNLIRLARKMNIPVVIDPKPLSNSFYRNAVVVTPNFKEACEMSGFFNSQNIDKDIEKMGLKLIRQLKSAVIITRGEKGMSIFKKDGKFKHIPTYSKEVYDVTGAGDTVVAVLALALSTKATLVNAAHISNYAAGVVVRKVGTATVSKEELLKALKNG